MEAVKIRIATQPGTGLPAPRPYPSMKKPGRLWLKQGRYWVAYSPTKPPTISGVFYETSDLPNRG